MGVRLPPFVKETGHKHAPFPSWVAKTLEESCKALSIKNNLIDLRKEQGCKRKRGVSAQPRCAEGRFSFVSLQNKQFAMGSLRGRDLLAVAIVLSSFCALSQTQVPRNVTMQSGSGSGSGSDQGINDIN